MFDHLVAKAASSSASAPARCARDAEALGTLDEDRNKMFAEAIDVILAIWERDPPYDIDLPGNRFKVTDREDAAIAEIGRGHLYKPYQKPRPEIVGTVVAPFSKGVIAMGERDFHPLSANFLLAHWLPSHWANYAEGKRKAGQTPDPADWRIARTIFVADDDKTARRYGRDDPNSPYRFYWQHAAARRCAARTGRACSRPIRSSPIPSSPKTTARPAGDPRHGQQGRRRDPEAARGGRAISASSSTPAWTGSIRRSPSARWS